MKVVNDRTQKRVMSIAQFYFSLALVFLVAVGIVGAGYHIMAPSGWVPRFLSSLWEKGILYIAFAVVCMVTVFAVARYWFFDENNTKNSDWIAYLWAIAGGVFLMKFIVFGTL